MKRTPKKPKGAGILEKSGMKPGVVASWTPNEFEGEEVERNLTFAMWKPEINDTRTFILCGFEERESKEFGGNFIVYFCQDLKTGEDFSFAPGGLFDYIIREQNIVNGDRLGVRFKGKVTLPQGVANQWDVVKLKKPALHPDHR